MEHSRQIYLVYVWQRIIIHYRFHHFTLLRYGAFFCSGVLTSRIAVQQSAVSFDAQPSRIGSELMPHSMFVNHEGTIHEPD
ncbi:hypothetical protein AGJ35_21115 [Cronobacter dublinensis subsp. dublinensis]|nr:hypothetical protein [Cronobacter dublinensis subsp. dublinensis]EGT5738238.1 hypothetical protein [Cronobacter dublinensis subsp. dublinensis]